jgi:hypothetical protein
VTATNSNGSAAATLARTPVVASAPSPPPEPPPSVPPSSDTPHDQRCSPTGSDSGCFDRLLERNDSDDVIRTSEIAVIPPAPRARRSPARRPRATPLHRQTFGSTMRMNGTASNTAGSATASSDATAVVTAPTCVAPTNSRTGHASMVARHPGSSTDPTDGWNGLGYCVGGTSYVNNCFSYKASHVSAASILRLRHDQHFGWRNVGSRPFGRSHQHLAQVKQSLGRTVRSPREPIGREVLQARLQNLARVE